jgi:hypothetical protein
MSAEGRGTERLKKNMEYETLEPHDSTSATADDYIERLPENVYRALSVWLSLSVAERDEVRKATEIFEGLSDPGRQKLSDIVIMVVTGPLETKCPYCGRG